MTKADPWYLDSWGTAGGPFNDVSPSQHDHGCNPVQVLREGGGGEILRSSMKLRKYLSDHRGATRGEIQSFLLTDADIDIHQMGRGAFYNARDNILCLLLQAEVDLSSVARSATSSEFVRQLLGDEAISVGEQAAAGAARDEASSQRSGEPISVAEGQAPSIALDQASSVLAQSMEDGCTIRAELQPFSEKSVLILPTRTCC